MPEISSKTSDDWRLPDIPVGVVLAIRATIWLATTSYAASAIKNENEEVGVRLALPPLSVTDPIVFHSDVLMTPSEKSSINVAIFAILVDGER